MGVNLIYKKKTKKKTKKNTTQQKNKNTRNGRSLLPTRSSPTKAGKKNFEAKWF